MTIRPTWNHRLCQRSKNSWLTLLQILCLKHICGFTRKQPMDQNSCTSSRTSSSSLGPAQLAVCQRRVVQNGCSHFCALLCAGLWVWAVWGVWGCHWGRFMVSNTRLLGLAQPPPPYIRALAIHIFAILPHLAIIVEDLWWQWQLWWNDEDDDNDNNDSDDDTGMTTLARPRRILQIN